MPVHNYITLSELAGQIRGVLTEAFASRSYGVVADITDHKFYAARGTHYFSLAEKHPITHILSSKLPAVAWADGGAPSIAAFQRITGQMFKSDIRVLVNVSVTFHKLYGLQVTVNQIDPSFTIGQLEQQRLDVLEQLVRECPAHVRRIGGRYLTSNNQMKLARVIQKVAVITSSNAAGYIDFKATLETNRHGYHIHLTPYFTTVQGEGSADALCQRIIDVKNSGVEYDAVVIIRGGGAQTDLLLFNQFSVAKAIASFSIPVITGIGHQINETIADLMAHTSVKTPSIAAETIVARNRAFEDGMLGMQQRIVIRSQQLMSFKHRELARLNNMLINTSRDIIRTNHHEVSRLMQRLTKRPLISFANCNNELSNVLGKLQTCTTKYIARKNNSLDHYQSLVRIMSPDSILKRGFAMIYQDNKIITDPNNLKPGESISIAMKNGLVRATINTIETTKNTPVNERTNTNKNEL